MLSINHLIMVAHITAVAIVFCDLLQQPKMVFALYGSTLDRLAAKSYGAIAYPIGYCTKCTAGHAALWVFMIRYFLGWESNSLALVRLICFCAVSILLALIGSRLLGRLDR